MKTARQFAEEIVSGIGDVSPGQPWIVDLKRIESAIRQAQLDIHVSLSEHLKMVCDKDVGNPRKECVCAVCEIVKGKIKQAQLDVVEEVKSLILNVNILGVTATGIGFMDSKPLVKQILDQLAKKIEGSDG